MTFTMELSACALAMSGLGFGLAAAWYWRKSTRVPVDPLNGNPHAIMPVLPELEQQVWWTAQFRAEKEIRRLNTLVARWTAQSTPLAVVLGTLSSVVGLF